MAIRVCERCLRWWRFLALEAFLVIVQRILVSPVESEWVFRFERFRKMFQAPWPLFGQIFSLSPSGRGNGVESVEQIGTGTHSGRILAGYLPI